MRKTILLAALLVAAAVATPMQPAHAMQAPAAPTWRRIDTALGAVATVAIAADCISTAYGLAHNRQSYETNPVLGGHPSRSYLAGVCAAGTGATWLIGWTVSAKPRRGWFIAVATVELGATLWNVTRR